jgi:acyl-CoA thioester hydrolase
VRRDDHQGHYAQGDRAFDHSGERCGGAGRSEESAGKVRGTQEALTMAETAQRPVPARRADFSHFLEITTRWGDNDAYGHVNNAVYYFYFDTVVNRFLIEQGGLDIKQSPVIGLVVETKCNYFKPIAYPESVYAGLRVEHIGNSSVRYQIALFRNNDDTASAQGHFVHVYVDRATNKPVALPERLANAVRSLAK